LRTNFSPIFGLFEISDRNFAKLVALPSKFGKFDTFGFVASLY